ASAGALEVIRREREFSSPLAASSRETEAPRRPASGLSCFDGSPDGPIELAVERGGSDGDTQRAPDRCAVRSACAARRLDPSVAAAMRVALFDMDKTLVRCNTMGRFLQHEYREGRI